MNFVIVDDNYVVNLDQVRYFYWDELHENLIVAVSMPKKTLSLYPQEAARILKICLDKGIPVPKWVVEKYAD